MAITTTWDETTPPDTQDPKFGAERIRDSKKELRERIINGDHFMEIVGPDSDPDAGKHICADGGGAGGGTTGVWRVFESNAHAGDRSTPALQIGDGAAALADTIRIGDGRDLNTRPYTFDVSDIVCKTLDVDTSITVTGLVTVDSLTVTGTVIGDLTLDDNLVVVGTSQFTGNVDLPDQTTQNIVTDNSNMLVNLTGTYQTMNSRTITTDTPAGKVLIMWRGTWHIVTISLSVISARLRRDAVQIAEWSNVAQVDPGLDSDDIRVPITLIWLDELASDGTLHTYDIQILDNTSALISAITISQRALIVSEYRNDIP